MDKLSYVLASGQREKVLAAVIPGPKTPAQIAQQTMLQLPHVSRALGQLVRAELVRSVGGERRGKLYSASDVGRAVFTELAETRGDRLIAPMARGSHFRNYHHWVATTFGRKAADDILREVGLDPATIDTDGWYPLRSALHALELIESRFGDGSYETIRRMLREVVPNFPSVRRLLTRVLPFPVVLELTPNAYNREFNHGRLEVEIQGRRAIMKNYDWMSSPARCAAWLGSYEGGLHMLGRKGSVSKVACMLRGDPYCGYLIEW
jgi:DNA-binding MarR family transcriptional regulator